MKKKIKDLTLEEISTICCKSMRECEWCPLNDLFGRQGACQCPATIYSDDERLEKEVEVDD